MACEETTNYLHHKYFTTFIESRNKNKLDLQKKFGTLSTFFRHFLENFTKKLRFFSAGSSFKTHSAPLKKF